MMFLIQIGFRKSERAANLPNKMSASTYFGQKEKILPQKGKKNFFYRWLMGGWVCPAKRPISAQKQTHLSNWADPGLTNFKGGCLFYEQRGTKKTAPSEVEAAGIDHFFNSLAIRSFNFFAASSSRLSSVGMGTERPPMRRSVSSEQAS